MAEREKPSIKINVAQLLKAPTGAVRRRDVSEDITGLDDELKIKSLLTGRLKLIRSSDSILVTASLQTVVELDCCRCLEPCTTPVELEIEEEFYPSVDIHTGAQLPVTQAEEEATIIDEQHVLDLTEVVRQAIFLALPMHPLCAQDCAGLCSQCGQNLNEGTCQCATDVTDPRLEILERLL
ncbi:MAG: hypothetical protein GTO63_03430 [Anaerolineae bacterium]|nr:hypothetical protein [Anaerolineae bacterium]NIN94063.1 hypothetical protein [Anaerolineae bacterium]NIQ77104.1 hypothetical protein [Anaerolineae bacterium]